MLQPLPSEGPISRPEHPAPKSRERRTDSRFIFSSARLAIDGQEAGLVEASGRGARFYHRERLAIGMFLYLDFQSPDSKMEVRVRGRVVWRDRPADSTGKWIYGVLFHQLEDETSGALLSLFKGPLIDRRTLDRRKDAILPFNDSRRSDRRSTPIALHKIQANAVALDKWKSVHTYFRVARFIDKPSAQNEVVLSSNSYLDLNTNPRVKEAATRAIEKFGVGSGGVPVLSGTTELHEELCYRIARFKGAEAAVIFPSGFIANFACISTLFNDKDALILNDELNHASLVDGCRMTRSRTRFFAHNNVEDLESKLERNKDLEVKVIIADGVFSMDGDICPYPELQRIAEKYGAMLMIDDAHATGVIGTNGRGTASHFNATKKPHITTATLSKALGVVGGAICSTRPVVKNITHLGRPFIFSTSLPPAICAAAIESINILEESDDLIKKLWMNIEKIKSRLTEIGFTLQESATAILPVIIGDEKKTYQIAQALAEEGVLVSAVSRPAVSRESSRLRLGVSAGLTDRQIDFAMEKFRKTGKSLGII